MNFQLTQYNVLPGAYRAGEGACYRILCNVDGEIQTWSNAT